MSPHCSSHARAGTLYAGPRKGTVTLGGSAYEGAVAGFTVLRYALDADDADCLYRDGEGQLEICATADMLAKERQTAYYGSFTSGGKQIEFSEETSQGRNPCE